MSLNPTLVNCDADDKPVYTKEMADNGESLDIGMMFATEAGEYHVDNINDKSICFVDEDGFYVGIPIGKAKPVRTDEEKAIDAACLVIDDSKRCIEANKNIDCSVAIKATVITLIKNGWSKS